LEYIHKRLSEYEYVGVGRDDGDKAGEFVPVFYRKERFKLMDKGTFWLSETPRTPSVGWDAQLKRICTYAFLQDKKTGKKLQFYNTHFSHVGESARTNSASLIIHYIDSLSQAGRVILTGDLNAEPDSPPYKTIKENGMKDSYNSGLNFGPYGTYNGFDIHGPYRRRIDYIFHKGFHSKSYQSINLLIDNRYLSDHFPIWSTLEYSPL
jgi:endonuclease/exonuclease/phosphatase family metal-dependent hydrolase